MIQWLRNLLDKPTKSKEQTTSCSDRQCNICGYTYGSESCLGRREILDRRNEHK